MTREEIIALAKEAWGEGKTYEFGSAKKWYLIEDMFVRFGRLVQAAEREACAKVCEEFNSEPVSHATVAGAIRARGEV